jgi:hypothetical protein
MPLPWLTPPDLFGGLPQTKFHFSQIWRHVTPEPGPSSTRIMEVGHAYIDDAACKRLNNGMKYILAALLLLTLAAPAWGREVDEGKRAIEQADRGTIYAEASTKSTVCNADEDERSTKDRDNDPVYAYEFGLKIQQYVERRDLQGLFSLVIGELYRGPRKKSIQGKSFPEFFSEGWRELVLYMKPRCKPVGWRGYMISHGQIWYRLDSKTGQWGIFAINGAQELEATKRPIDGSWQYQGKYLTWQCFVTEWLSSDNYEEFYDQVVKDRSDISFRDLVDNIGQHIGGLIPLEPIAPRWDETTELSLVVKLPECLRDNKLLKLKIEEGWIVRIYYCTSRRCLNAKYRALKHISPSHCNSLLPNFAQTCLDLRLVEIVEELDGSMGSTRDVGIYGIFEDPISKHHYVAPLKYFYGVNDALNYIDQLDQ